MPKKIVGACLVIVASAALILSSGLIEEACSAGTEAVFPNTLNVFYYHKTYNFGDMLNEDLLKYFSLRHNLTSERNAKYIFIGSILGRAYQENINVFGTGFIKEPSKSFKFSGEINAYCLRGKLTRDHISRITGKNLDGCLLGDPGLMCSKIFPQNEKKIYDVGIICHKHDKNSQYIKNIKLKHKTYTFIDIQGKTKNVCKKINQCRFILSSAMHGLIASDSYGIPNQRIILADSCDPASTRYDFKFDDYYSIYEGITIPKAIDLKRDTIHDSDIVRFTENYNIPQSTVSDFCGKYTNLIENYFCV